jgi:hypothetical protein
MRSPGSTHRIASRMKKAELASTVGAGLAGVGLGALLAAWIEGLAVVALATGALMHSWGMYDKHAAERDLGGRGPLWTQVLYWLCWLVLAGLALTVLLRSAM